MKINKIRRIRNLMLIQKNLTVLSVGMVLMGASIAATSIGISDPSGAVFMYGGLCVSTVAQNYRDLAEFIIDEDEEVSKQKKK